MFVVTAATVENFPFTNKPFAEELFLAVWILTPFSERVSNTISWWHWDKLEYVFVSQWLNGIFTGLRGLHWFNLRSWEQLSERVVEHHWSCPSYPKLCLDERDLKHGSAENHLPVWEQACPNKLILSVDQSETVCSSSPNQISQVSKCMSNHINSPGPLHHPGWVNLSHPGANRATTHLNFFSASPFQVDSWLLLPP